MFNFELNGKKCKIFFQHKTKSFQKQKADTKCFLLDVEKDEIVNQTIAICSFEDNFHKEYGRQVSLIRLMMLNNNDELNQIIISNYFKDRQLVSLLPEKEKDYITNLL